MSISTVQIANFALSKAGLDSTIESLTENSAEANACNLWFDHSRDQVLASYAWTFAHARETLAAHVNDPSADWGYRYIYPVDSIKIRELERPLGKDADPIPFIVELATNGTKSILTDLGSAVAIYTKTSTNPLLYTPGFIEAIATTLAAHIAFPLTGKTKLAQYLESRASLLLRAAPALDANEQQEAKPRDAEATRGRY
jgi:hypothetical protein